MIIDQRGLAPSRKGRNAFMKVWDARISAKGQLKGIWLALWLLCLLSSTVGSNQ